MNNDDEPERYAGGPTYAPPRPLTHPNNDEDRYSNGPTYVPTHPPLTRPTMNDDGDDRETQRAPVYVDDDDDDRRTVNQVGYHSDPSIRKDGFRGAPPQEAVPPVYQNVDDHTKVPASRGRTAPDSVGPPAPASEPHGKPAPPPNHHTTSLFDVAVPIALAAAPVAWALASHHESPHPPPQPSHPSSEAPEHSGPPHAPVQVHSQHSESSDQCDSDSESDSETSIPPHPQPHFQHSWQPQFPPGAAVPSSGPYSPNMERGTVSPPNSQMLYAAPLGPPPMQPNNPYGYPPQNRYAARPAPGQAYYPPQQAPYPPPPANMYQPPQQYPPPNAPYGNQQAQESQSNDSHHHHRGPIHHLLGGLHGSDDDSRESGRRHHGGIIHNLIRDVKGK